MQEKTYKIAETAVQYGQVTREYTKKGKKIILSEENYNGLNETIYLSSNQKLKKSIIKGLNTRLEDTIPEEDVEWDNV